MKYRPQRLTFTIDYAVPDDVDPEAYVRNHVAPFVGRVNEAIVEATTACELTPCHRSLASERLDDPQPWEAQSDRTEAVEK